MRRLEHELRAVPQINSISIQYTLQVGSGYMGGSYAEIDIDLDEQRHSSGEELKLERNCSLKNEL